jgi:hypothetical protein
MISRLQLVGLSVLEREERLDPSAAAVADDDDDIHLEGADGVLDGGPDAGVLGLRTSSSTSVTCQMMSRSRGYLQVCGSVPCRRVGPCWRCCGRRRPRRAPGPGSPTGTRGSRSRRTPCTAAEGQQRNHQQEDEEEEHSAASVGRQSVCDTSMVSFIGRKSPIFPKFPIYP